MLATAARGVLPFYVIYLGTRSDLTGGRIAALTVAFTVAQSGSAILWGLLADRSGFRSVYLLAISCWMAASLLLLASDHPVLPYAVFLLLGAGVSGTMMADQNLVLEFGAERDRAMRIAATNSLAEAVGTASFLVAGLAADLAPLWCLFVTSMTLQLFALLRMAGVQDPRALS